MVSIAVSALAAGAVAWAFFPAVANLLSQWVDGESRYSHGLLAFGAVLYIAWRNAPRRYELQEGARFWFALSAVAGISLLWFAAHEAVLITLEQLLLFMLAVTAVSSLLRPPAGTQVAIIIAPLLFALPFWDLANGLFLNATIAVVRVLLVITGVEASFDGPFVILPAGIFEIAPTCNGLQLFLAAATTGSLFVAYRKERPVSAFWLVAGAAFIGVLANWLRVYVVVMAGYLTDMQHYLVTSEHYTLGWSLFAVGIAVYLRWASGRPLPSARQRANGEAPRPAVGALRYSSICAALMLGPCLVLVSRLVGPSPTEEMPAASVAGWEKSMRGGDEWVPVFVGHDRQSIVEYRQTGDESVVYLYSAVYSRVSEGKEIAGLENQLWPAGWRMGESVPGVQGSPAAVNRLADLSGRPWLVVGRFKSGTRSYSSARLAQVDFAVSRLLGLSDGVRVVAIATICESDCRAELVALQRFVAAAPSLL